MPTPINPEWLNQNAYRNYPFLEDASLSPENDVSISIPTYFIVDLIITVASSASITLRLTRVASVGGFITCVFSAQDDNAVFSVSVDANTHEANSSYPVVGEGDYSDARGSIVFGDLTRLAEDFPDGNYLFGIPCEGAVVRPDLRGVRSVKVGRGGNLSDFIRGNINLIEGTNIRLTYLPSQNAIRIDAINGAGFNQECDCETTYQPPDCIRFINGVNADDFSIVGDGKCVEVTTNGNVITISDSCSEPCCGCEELELITQNLRLQEATLSRVEEYADVLRNRIEETIIAMLASTKGG